MRVFDRPPLCAVVPILPCILLVAVSRTDTKYRCHGGRWYPVIFRGTAKVHLDTCLPLPTTTNLWETRSPGRSGDPDTPGCSPE